jgi:hypothetical protein
MDDDVVHGIYRHHLHVVVGAMNAAEAVATVRVVLVGCPETYRGSEVSAAVVVPS